MSANLAALAGCFVDSQRPVSEAEKRGWKFFLALPRAYWKGARIAFRRVHVGMPPGEALLGFVADTGVTDPELLAELETVLRDLAAELAPGRPHKVPDEDQT